MLKSIRSLWLAVPLISSLMITAAHAAPAMLGGDPQHTNTSPHAGSANPMQKTWVFNTSGRLSYTTPVIDGTTLFYGTTGSTFVPPVSDVGSFYAIDLKDGHEVWSRDDIAVPMHTNPAVDEFAVYVVDVKTRGLVALDKRNGTELWRYSASALSSVVINDGFLYLSSSTHLICLNKRTGNVQWKTAFVGTKVLAKGPTIYDKRIYLATKEGEVIAYDLANGKKQWTTRIPRPITTAIAASEGVLVFGTGFLPNETSSSVFAISANDGKTLWKFDIDGTYVGMDVAIDHTRVFFGTAMGRGHIYALDLHSGNVQWKYALTLSSSALALTLSTSKNRLYLSGGRERDNEEAIMILDAATGKRLAIYTDFTRGNGIWMNPVLYRSKLIIGVENRSAGDMEGQLYMIE